MTAIYTVSGGDRLAWGLATALPGIAGVVALSLGSGLALGRWISVLGFYSLEIYLGHPLFSTAARAVMSRLGFQSASINVFFGVFAGVFFSLALALLCQKLKFPFLFRWPASLPPGNPSSPVKGKAGVPGCSAGL